VPNGALGIVILKQQGQTRLEIKNKTAFAQFKDLFRGTKWMCGFTYKRNTYAIVSIFSDMFIMTEFS